MNAKAKRDWNKRFAPKLCEMSITDVCEKKQLQIKFCGFMSDGKRRIKIKF